MATGSERSEVELQHLKVHGSWNNSNQPGPAEGLTSELDNVVRNIDRIDRADRITLAEIIDDESTHDVESTNDVQPAQEVQPAQGAQSADDVDSDHDANSIRDNNDPYQGNDTASDVNTNDSCSIAAHQRLQDEGLEGSSNTEAPNAVEASEAVAVEDTLGRTWQPMWLGGEVLAAFTGLFALMTLGIPILLCHSTLNDGIRSTQSDFAYVWRFGPTAVLTIIAALWGRVELQAMRYTTWIALQANENFLSESGCVLDYMSMSVPVILVQSIRRKHHRIFLSSIISLLLKAQISLAPALFSLDSGLQHDASVKILDSFNTSINFPLRNNSDSLRRVYLLARAVHDFDLLRPLGLDENAVYETFRLEDHRFPSSRGSNNATLKVVVNAMFSKLQCLPLESYSLKTAHVLTSVMGANIRVDIDARFKGCDKTISSWSVLDVPRAPTRNTFWHDSYDYPPNRSCSALPQQNNQFVRLTGIATRTDDDPASVEILAAAGVICSPVTWLAKVEVTDDGIHPNITTLPNDNKIPVNVDLWGMILNAFPEAKPYYPGHFGTSPRISRRQYVYINPGGHAHDQTFPESAYYDNEYLLASTNTLFSKTGPILSHYLLRHQENSTASGSIIIPFSRLKVVQGTALSMTALSATTTFMAFLIYLFCQRNRSLNYWHQDPATIFGSIVFFARNPTFLKYSSPFTNLHSTVAWSVCNTSPMVLRPWIRSFATIWVLNIIFWMTFTQKHPDILNGITVTTGQDTETHTHFFLSLGLTLTMLSVSLYANASCFAHKSLCIFWLTSSGICNTKLLDYSVLDVLGIRALYRSIRLKAYTVTTSQFLAFICGLLTTLGSVLLVSEEYSPKTQIIQLHQTTTLGSQEINASFNGDPTETRSKLSSLLLLHRDDDFMYPQNTYKDLVFPTFNTESDIKPSSVNSITAIIPALKLHANCSKLSTNEYDLKINKHKRPDGSRSGYFRHRRIYCLNNLASYMMKIRPSDIHIPRPQDNGTSSIGEMVMSECDQAVFKTERRLPRITVITRTYIWGAISETEHDFNFLSVWQCNYEWVEVSTEAHLINMQGNWVLDSTKPPSPDITSMKPRKPSFGIPRDTYIANDGRFGMIYPFNRYDDSTEKTPLDGLNGNFIALLQPYGTLPLEVLRDPSQEQRVLQSLNYNFGLITAQLANVESRVDINASLSTASPPVNATVGFQPQHRLVQNPTIMYAIVTILSAVIVNNLWSLLSTIIRRLSKRKQMRLLDVDVKGLAPDTFNSIAATISLLQDSNAFAHITKYPEGLLSDKIHDALSSLTFRLGWFESMKASDPVRHFTVGVLEDKDFKFLGVKGEIEVTEN